MRWFGPSCKRNSRRRDALGPQPNGSSRYRKAVRPPPWTQARSGGRSCMNAGKAFFDTNVLLYMYSSADPRKQHRARELYREHARDGRVLLSTQVVQEFFVAALRKLKLPREQV